MATLPLSRLKRLYSPLHCKQCGKEMPAGSIASWESLAGQSGNWRCVEYPDGSAGCWADRFAPEDIARKRNPAASPSPAASSNGNGNSHNGNGHFNTVSNPAAASSPNGADGLAAVLGPLAGAIAPYLEDRIAGKVDEDRVLELIEQAINSTSYTRIETTLNGEPLAKLEGAIHPQVPTILELLRCGANVYAYGPPGAGKTHLAAQVAQALNVPMHVFQLGKMSPESAIKGFIDASGTLREQEFLEAISSESLVFLDELDRWPAHLVTLLNSLLANGYIVARGHGQVRRHDRCYILGAGNTAMRGRDDYFPEATAQEFSTLDRFAFVHVDYDSSLEDTISLAINPAAKPWVEWVRKLRPEALSGRHGKVLATPRAMYDGARYLRYTSLSVDAIARITVFKGISESTVTALLAQFPLPTGPMKPQERAS